MAAGPPYSVHSPTQQPRFPSFSPSSRDRPPYANNESYQHSPHTPPHFPPPPQSHSRSPHFGHAQTPMTTTLPPLNSSVMNSDTSSPYHGHGHGHGPSGPGSQFTLPRPFSSSIMSSTSHGMPQSMFNHLPPPHTHPSNSIDSVGHSPKREREPSLDITRQGSLPYPSQSPLQRETPRPVSPKETKPARATDPMSFASILSAPDDERPTQKASPPPQVHKAREEPPTMPSPAPPKLDNEKLKPVQEKRSGSHHNGSPPYIESPSRPTINGTSSTKHSLPFSSVRARKVLSERDNEKVTRALEYIDNMDLSDVESPGFDLEWERYALKGRKRAREAETFESRKRKKRRTEYLSLLAQVFEKQSLHGMKRFARLYEPSIQAEVHQQEVRDEKERKKDMQRKRRRENTVRQETEKIAEAERKADIASDEGERERLLREIEKSRKKIKTTRLAMEGGTAMEEISEVTPLSPNLEGGTISSFHIDTKSSPVPKKKSGKSGGSSARPKKSKEKKQAEKDAAEAAYLAQENDELVAIAPKEEPVPKKSKKKDAKAKAAAAAAAARSKEVTPAPVSTFDTKGYAQLFEQIWRDIARKDIPKVFKVKAVAGNTRQENLRKTAQLASKVSKRWLEKVYGTKTSKEVQAKAKKCMRDMMTFWKRNEREERDLRRLAEKQELELAKKAEADREANRQRRKLNFLISQTELYSHFIGRKIKTSEAEHHGDDAAAAPPADSRMDDASMVLPEGTKVTKFEDLDFDAEDETALRLAAMASAQNAVQQAQERAKNFNGDDQMAAFDDGEMNFLHPTSFGDVEVSQPKMLTAQLKEYQLKGLNWLVNLYEQGINGILADEMGLGKTIQSIAVMAYLAEVHNIWGPFLVIAPASTLHNWQQEITRFVPGIKVLPYWGSAKDRKVLRKFWDRKHITYTKESEFHVLVTSYQLVVLDAQYFQKVKWQYMVLDEAQAIKSSQSSRWKSLLGFNCRNRLLLTGTPIQNNMQELWALLHFIMPTLFDSHEEFSEWFSKDIESHAQSHTKLNEDQLKRLHMILKPFMLRRIKKHVQKELGDKVEKDVFCDLTYRQRAYYSSLRNRVSLLELIEKAAGGDDSDSTTLMNLVMQFRKVCNHPDLFERADTKSPFFVGYFAETASFVREGDNIYVGYSTRNSIEYDLPRLLCSSTGRLDIAGPDNDKAGFEGKYLAHMMNVWTPENIRDSAAGNETFSFLRFVDTSVGEAYKLSHQGVFERAALLRRKDDRLARLEVAYDEADDERPSTLLPQSMFNIMQRNGRRELSEITCEGRMYDLLNVTRATCEAQGLRVIEPCAKPGAAAPPVTISCSGQSALAETRRTFFNISVRHALFGHATRGVDEEIIDKKVNPAPYSAPPMLPEPGSNKGRFTHITVPSMRRFVTDSGKLGKLDHLLHQLKNGGHRVLLYFQMTKMIDLVEEYLTYRNYKYCRLDGSTKLEDRRDTVADFQSRQDIFVFLLSTRAGGLGINLTAADTVIFYDSDWNPTIDSQAMDRAHRLGQTRQVTVYRLITRGTIEERIRKRALQKEEVQRVVISGGAAGGVDFNTRSRENRTKDIAMWLADDEQAEILEQREREALEKGEEFGAAKKGGKRAAKAAAKRAVTLDDMYHEGEGHFEDMSAKPSGAATPISTGEGEKGTGGPAGSKRTHPKGRSKKAKTTQERLRFIDGGDD